MQNIGEQLNYKKQNKIMSKNLTVNDICEYIATASPKDLYFIQKAIEHKRHENVDKMFEGPTKW